MPVDMKLMIASAFVQLARKKPIDKITVKDLVEQCGISRQAFYYHFRDLLDVMEWSIRQMIQQALENSLRAESPEKALEKFIRLGIEHHDLLVRLLASQRRFQVECMVVEAMRSSVRQMIYNKKPDLTVNFQDLEVALNFYAYGLTGVVFENCRDANISAEQLAEKLYQVISGRMLEV